jgi:hypothetical protein
MDAQRTRITLLGLGLLTAGTAFAKHSLDASMAGWTPMVTLWGGDEGTAVKSLKRITQAYGKRLQARIGLTEAR